MFGTVAPRLGPPPTGHTVRRATSVRIATRAPNAVAKSTDAWKTWVRGGPIGKIKSESWNANVVTRIKLAKTNKIVMRRIVRDCDSRRIAPIVVVAAPFIGFLASG